MSGLRPQQVWSALSSFLDGFVRDLSPTGDHAVRFSLGDAKVFVAVTENEVVRGETSSFVSISVPVAMNVPLTPSLWEWVARNSDLWLLGHLHVATDDGGAIPILHHRLIADRFDLNDFEMAIMTMSKGAPDIGGRIMSQFGGEPYI